jgi:hypothetical protein
MRGLFSSDCFLCCDWLLHIPALTLFYRIVEIVCMKKVLFFSLLLAGVALHAQPIVQPVATGDYWQIDEYKQRLPELANQNTFPRTITFANGYAGVSNVKANRIIGANELHWMLSGAQNVSDFYIEFSRDLRTFERAGIVRLLRTDFGNKYVFRHQFNDQGLVYYRLALVRDGQILAYTPAVQVLDEEARTKVFPTHVQGSTFYVETGTPYEKLEVVNSSSQSVYQKGLGNQTGTITVGLPSLPKGIYFVRLLSDRAPQHVQRILVQ